MKPQEAWEARGKLYDKYNDPNWMLQAGLGDIEFEQDMYDDIRYGGISEEGADFGYAMGFSDDPYDVTGLAGLREHATKGPTRYLDYTPFDLPSEKYDTDKFGFDITAAGARGLGRYNIREDAFGEGTGETTNIDINLPGHINWWDRAGREGGHALQNMISDTYRHEYKHSPTLTSHRNPYHHQAIYGQGAKYGLSPLSREKDFQRFMNPPEENFPTVHYNPSRAAETSRDISSFASNPWERSFEQPTNRAVSRQPARGPHDYQAGGSVNPHEETTRAARDWSPRGQNYRAEPYRPDLNREITPPMAEPYRPDWNREPTQPFPLGQASSDWNNSGVMLAMNNNPAVKRAKSIYNQVDPYTPDIDWNEKTLGYDFNLPLWGGNLGFEFDYDIDDENYGAGINWSTGWGA